MAETTAQTQKNVLVIGHRNPDTDSICSAIAYAYLKNKINPALHYEPRRAGKVNSETKFVLDYFHMDTPQICLDVSPQVEDLTIRRVEGVQGSLSMKDAWNLMQDIDANTLVIVDEDNRIQGLITMTDVAKAYMDAFDATIMTKAETTYRNIVKTLDGELVVGDLSESVCEGKICVAAGNAATMASVIEKGDTVILSNRVDSQMLAIELGAGCMVVTGGNAVPQHIQRMAKNHDTTVLCTPYDSYTAARLISQSAPVSYFMTKGSLLSFSLKAPVEDVQKVMVKVRHRYFPVLDLDGRYYGMISRRNMMDLRKKQVIMVDHNEPGQAVEGLMAAEVLEIIDHHRLGSGLQTSAPVYFRNQPVGCTATIIYQMYQENGVKIPREIAGLMCSAILSDTLAFRSPTCTVADKNAAENLAAIAGVEIDEYASEMFEAGASLDGKTAKDLFYADFKPFVSGSVRFGIGQSSFMSDRSAQKAKDLLLPYLNEVLEKEGIDMVCYMLTNILTQSTDLIFAGKHAKEIVAAAFAPAEPSDFSVLLPGVVSRKKQMVPNLTKGIAEWEADH